MEQRGKGVELKQGKVKNSRCDYQHRDARKDSGNGCSARKKRQGKGRGVQSRDLKGKRAIPSKNQGKNFSVCTQSKRSLTAGTASRPRNVTKGSGKEGGTITLRTQYARSVGEGKINLGRRKLAACPLPDVKKKGGSGTNRRERTHSKSERRGGFIASSKQN